MPHNGSEGADDTQLSIVCDEGDATVIELRAAGVVLLPALRDALRQLGEARTTRRGARTVLVDTEGVERFGRGAVMEAARWITRHAGSFDHAVVVTRSPSMKSAVLALATCAPQMRHTVVATRARALEAIEHAPVRRLTG